MDELFEAAGFKKSLYKHLKGIDLEALYLFCKSDSFEVIVNGYLSTEGNSQEKAEAITAFISEHVSQDSSAIAKQGKIEYLVLDLDFLNYALQYFKEFVEIKEVHELLYILKKAIYNKNDANYLDNRIYIQTGFFDSIVFDNHKTININVVCFWDSDLWVDYVSTNFAEGFVSYDYPLINFINFTSQNLLQHEETIHLAVNFCPSILEYVSDKLKDNIDIVLSAINSATLSEEGEEILSGWVLEYASNRLKDNKEVVLAAVSNDEYVLYYASERLKDDKEIVLASVRRHGNSLKFASARLQDDKEVVVVAVSGFLSGSSLEFASERLRDNKEVVIAAISTEADALKFASERLKDDSEIVLSAVKCIEYVHHEYFEEYGKSGWAIKYASQRLKEDKEFIFKVVSEDAEALKYLSDMLKDDKKIILAAVTKDGYALEFSSERLRDDKEVVLAAVSKDGYALKYVSERLRDDEGIVHAAVSNYGNALQYASDRLKIKYGYDYLKNNDADGCLKDNDSDDLPF